MRRHHGSSALRHTLCAFSHFARSSSLAVVCRCCRGDQRAGRALCAHRLSSDPTCSRQLAHDAPNSRSAHSEQNTTSSPVPLFGEGEDARQWGLPDDREVDMLVGVLCGAVAGVLRALDLEPHAHDATRRRRGCLVARSAMSDSVENASAWPRPPSAARADAVSVASSIVWFSSSSSSRSSQRTV
jgi:hypothetical protein